MISVGELDSYTIAEQCEENEIQDYLFYKSMRETFPEWDSLQMIRFITVPGNRSCMRKDIWLKRALRLQRQVDYFKNHADIQHIKPARGRLRSRQLECVQISSEFFEKISGLGIKPILYGGCLLGHIRHNGFIPWDDDMDFALIRDEYEKLKEFCRVHIYEEHECEVTFGDKKDIADGLEDYFWDDKYNYFCVFKELTDGHRVYIEFFSLDYYADDYKFQDLKKYASTYIAELAKLDSPEKKIKYVQRALIENKLNTVKESHNLFFGIDNMEFMVPCYPREQFIPKEVLFPLKKVLFEKKYFWVPNDAEELLKYELWDIWDFPPDVGLQRHCEINENEEE